MLEVRGVCAAYERSQVLFDVDLTAPRRGAIAVLGRNGAGKTTLMKAIVGEMPARGEISLDGRDAARLPTEQRVRLGIGYVPQEHGVFGRLSVRENLEVGAAVAGDRKAIDQVLTIFPKLAQRLRQPAATLSGGERKMLAIGRALLARPKLLLLDEPTEGVWIGVIGEIAERVRELVKEMSIVLVEQHLEFALDVASYAYVLDRGRIALHGQSASVRSDARLLQYLAP
ncbi:MAG: ABC transporter ATP-binding protein [Candidatus Rokubacteria bacterium]|nr:ABC transporter ATP-binding protein [Candidatus Rokubacteria bacterium]